MNRRGIANIVMMNYVTFKNLLQTSTAIKNCEEKIGEYNICHKFDTTHSKKIIIDTRLEDNKVMLFYHNNCGFDEIEAPAYMLHHNNKLYLYMMYENNEHFTSWKSMSSTLIFK